jgi:hypothetical protein
MLKVIEQVCDPVGFVEEVVFVRRRGALLPAVALVVIRRLVQLASSLL